MVLSGGGKDCATIVFMKAGRNRKTAEKDAEEQRKINEAAAQCLGVLAGGDPRRSEKVREIVRERLRRKYAGHPDENAKAHSAADERR